MSPNISARYTIPAAIPHELIRDKVISLLNQDVKVTVLVAPSGYGKSVVAAQWARQQQNVIWIRLTQEDRDAQFLVQALAEGIRSHGISLTTWNDHTIREVAATTIVSSLLSDVNLWPHDLTFILDGGEYLSPNSAGILARFIDELNGHRVILLQHSSSPFEIAPYIVQGSGQEINTQHLAFTAQESDELSRSFEVSASQNLHKQLDGWPAGVMLSLYAHDQQLTLTPGDLIRTLIQRLDLSIRSQLPALSVMDMWTAATPAALKLQLPPTWLIDMQRVGLPLTPQDRGYAPHDVLRSYLQQELAAKPEIEKQMHRHAGAWAERQGEPYSAVKHFLASDDEKAALKVAEDLLPGWYRTANWLVARDVLSQFSDGVLTDELRSILALAYGETNDAIKAEELALRQLKINETATAYFALALKGYRTNDSEKAMQYTERGLKISNSQRDTIQLLRMKAVLLIKTGLKDDALEIAREATRRAIAFGDNALKLSAQAVYAHVYRTLSKSNAENIITSEQLYLTAKDTESPHRLIAVIQNYSIDLIRVNRESESIALLSDFIEKYKGSYPLCQQLLVDTLASAYRKAGQSDKALETAKLGVEINQKAGIHTHVDDCFSIIVWHYLGCGDDEMARSTAASFLRYMEQNNYNSPPHLGRMALYNYAIGNLDKAKQFIHLAIQNQQELDIGEPLVLTLKLIITSESGQKDVEIINALCESLKLYTEDIGILKSGWKRVSPIFYSYASAYPNLPIIDQTIRSVEMDGARLNYTVNITTFGTEALAIQGTPLRQVYSTAFESLVYHLLHPEAPQDELAQIIWGTTDLYKARGSAQKARGTLNKMFRETLGGTNIELIHTSGPGRRNLEWHVSPDVIIRLDALQVLNSFNADEIHSLYQGQFLPGNSHEWAIDERQYINKHISEVYQRTASEKGNTREGLKWLMRAAMIDQEVSTFEKALKLSIVLGDNSIKQSAEEALVALAQGNEVHLNGWLN